MDAFPPDIRSHDGDVPTRMICPDCSGSLAVQAIDNDRNQAALVFKCRVGHVYGVEALLIGKEAHIERTMWAAVFAYEELAAVLRDLGRRDSPDTEAVNDDERRRRLERAADVARGLRALIDRDESIRLKNPPVD